MSNLELNKGDNFIFLIDVSGSMAATDTPNGDTRLSYSLEQAATFIGEANKYDTDGVDVAKFGHKVTSIGKLTADNAKSELGKLTPNEGATETSKAIEYAWKLHRSGGYQQTCAMVITDGEPSDEQALFKTIAAITQELKDEHEFAISILTVGNRSASLEAFLTKLDDSLPGAKHDIVDVKRLEEVDFVSAFVGALHD